MIRSQWRVWRAAFGENKKLIAMAFGAGLIMAGGQAPVSISALGLAGLVGIFAVFLRARDAPAAAWIGWAGAVGYFAAGMFWIVEPFFVDPLRHGWMAPFALFLLPAGLGLFWMLAFGLAARLSRGWRRPFAAAGLLAAVEILRTFVLTGFPWALIGYMWIGAPQMQIASVIGPHGLTLATTLVAALTLVWIGRRRVWLAAPAVAASVLVGAGVWGDVQLAKTDIPRSQPVTVRIVQPNAEQHLKWQEGMAVEFTRRLLNSTAATPIGRAPDVVVWPETAVQDLLIDTDVVFARIDRASGGRPVAFGIVRRDGQRVYNSLVVTEPGGAIADIYDKYHLTPFGEYMPLGDFFARFGINGMAASAGRGFSAGPGPRLVEIAGVGRVLPLICYEAIFAHNLFTEDRADWILHVTNDAWFGEISGPYQHLAQARLRAVEQGLPVVRAANTGVSAVIDGRGRVVGQIPLGQAGHLDADLPPSLPRTVYASTGDWPVFLILALVIAATVFPFRRETH